MGLFTALLFKPVKLLFAPIKLIYLFAGVIVIAGVMGGVVAGDFELFAFMMFLAVIWSVTYTLFSP